MKIFGAGLSRTGTLSLSRAVGMPSGITAGQAWESESVADLQVYQRAKTGALFVGAAMAGAAAEARWARRSSRR